MKRFISVLVAITLAGMALAAVAADDGKKKEVSLFATPEINYPVSDPVLGLIDARDVQSLNGEWNFIVDPMRAGGPGGFMNYLSGIRNDDGLTLVEYNFDTADKIRVPGDFNTQQERLFFYQGVVWYQKTITKPALTSDERIHLWFGGANFTTQVFLNGEPVGQHIGGYVPFSFDVTDTLKEGENNLIVRVNNKLDTESVPTYRTDWWPYGGLTRDVALVKTPKAFIRNAKVRLAKGSYDRIDVDIETVGLSGQTVAVQIDDLGVKASAKVGADGVATLSINAKPNLWSPTSPTLYDVVIRGGNDELADSIGFRHIETRGQQIYLNGEAIKFKGISTHEEPIGLPGAAYSQAHVEGLIKEAKALGVNFIRAAHYPYSRYMAKVADRLGVMLWEEVPVYWNISWENPETLKVARDQMARLVQRDWNRASVVVWSVANETPYSEPRMNFLGTLIDDTRNMDESRLVSAALLGGIDSFGKVAKHIAAKGLVDDNTSPGVKQKFKDYLARQEGPIPSATDHYNHVVSDPLGEITDIVSYNQYFGWYYSGMMNRMLDVSQADVRPLMFKHMADMSISSVFDKPIHISEFGAGAKAGNKGGAAHIWTEEYQANVYRAQTKMLANSPQVQGMTPWILKDFRAMLRALSGVQDYYNRKGLIDENGQRKQAYFVLQDFYNNNWE